MSSVTEGLLHGQRDSTAWGYFNFFNWYSGGWSPIWSTRHCGHQWPIVPVPDNYDDGEIGGMIGKGNWSTQRKPVPGPLRPPQTPHAARTRTLAAAVGSKRLTALATVWLLSWLEDGIELRTFLNGHLENFLAYCNEHGYLHFIYKSFPGTHHLNI
jgi:hypothetical protein